LRKKFAATTNRVMSTDKIFEYFDCLVDGSLGPSDIDEFLSFVRQSTERQLGKLCDEERELTPDKLENDFDLQEHRALLAYKVESINGVTKLAYELSLLALMKKTEIRLSSILREKVPAYAARVEFKFKDYKEALGSPRYELVTGREAFWELHLLTNSIKHNGKVSGLLAKHFPGVWFKNAELIGLDAAYTRLRDRMVEFVSDYVTAIYAAHPRP
jgi:hypothetical protein